MKLSVWLLVTCGVVAGGTLVACGNSDDGSDDDMTASPDAAPGVDAAAPLPDASSPADASSQDAATADDAAALDASAPQDAAVPPPDSSAPDAGTEDAAVDAAVSDADADSGPPLVYCRIYVQADQYGDPAGYITVAGCNDLPPQNVRSLGGVRAINYYSGDANPPGSESSCTWPVPPEQGAPITSPMYGNCTEGSFCSVEDGAMAFHNGTCVRN